jgi:hypothetical protein
MSNPYQRTCAGKTLFGGREKKHPFAKSADFSMEVPIVKADDEERVVYGFASVADEDGQPVVDRQGDILPVTELVKVAHKFIKSGRVGGIMHKMGADGKPVSIGEVVESVVLRPELQKALGIDLKKSAWLIGVHISDDETWARVKKGELGAFSIGGRGKRKNMA